MTQHRVLFGALPVSLLWLLGAGVALAQDAAPPPCDPLGCPQPSVGVACCIPALDACGIDVGGGCMQPCVPAYCPVQGPGLPCCLGAVGPCGMDTGSGCQASGGTGGTGGGGAGGTGGGTCDPLACPLTPLGPPCCTPSGTCGAEQTGGVCVEVSLCADASCPSTPAQPGCCMGPFGPCGSLDPAAGVCVEAPPPPCDPLACPPSPLGPACCTATGRCGGEQVPGVCVEASVCDEATCPPTPFGPGCCLSAFGSCGAPDPVSGACVPLAACDPLACPDTPLGPPCCTSAGRCGGEQAPGVCVETTFCQPMSCPTTPDGPGCCLGPFGPCGSEHPEFGCVDPQAVMCDPAACGPGGCCVGPYGPCGQVGLFGCGPAIDAGAPPPPCSTSGDAQPDGSLCSLVPQCAADQCRTQIEACDANEACRRFAVCWLESGCTTNNCPACNQFLDPASQSLALALKSCADSANCTLGATCTTDADCSAGLTCLGAGAATIDGAFPARGLCTAPCTESADCHRFDIKAFCVGLTEAPQGADAGADGGGVDAGGTDGGVVNGRCVEGCQVGPQGLQTFSNNKCHGRLDMGCTPFREGGPNGPLVSACTPFCGSDATCGAGAYCNPRTGLCQPTALTGLPLGAKCPRAPDGGVEGWVDECRGNCAGLQDETGDFTTICGERCVTGVIGCGWSGPGSTGGGVCIFTYTDTVTLGGPGAGDMGACAALCNCDDECANPDLSCIPADALGRPDLPPVTGKAGLCNGRRGVNPGISVCPDAGTTITDAGTDADLGACSFGAVKSCRGPGDCLGVQRCNGDASGYDSCTCVDGGAPSDAGTDASLDAGPDAPVDGGGGSGGGAVTDARPDARPALPVEEDGGCGCRAAPARTSAWAALAVLFGGALWRRRADRPGARRPGGGLLDHRTPPR